MAPIQGVFKRYEKKYLLTPEKYQAVMWKVEAEIDKTRDLNSVYQRWSLMEKYFAEINTPWRCPKAMNPGMMFD